ncbi:MAG: Gfo/Idh/MocA family oxidoreductase [Saprospiraceae bacterium]|nr:Gfo/Idh/MocA family oxidoreductase [Saprospiraceae bacterium]MCB9322700.1 Gfo/Idh/MocA family oxidoreductase [Lewinellaceae bacterium]
MKDKPIVIIGGGSIGQRHIKNLQSLGFSNIFCLKRAADPAFETKFQVEVLTDYRELEHIQPWAVFICNPTSLHVESLEIAVRNGAHIFMEKPLIHNEEGLQKARSIMEGYDKVFFIGFMLRFHPLVKALKGIIEEGELGDVYSARFEFGSYLPYWHPWEDYKISYASNNALGGGVINTITHELDLVQYFFGKPESVMTHKTNLHKLDIEVEELFEGILIYNNKLVTLHLDYLQKDYDRRIRMLFDEGSVTWNWHENELVVKKHKSEIKKIELKDFEVNQLYIDELKSFFELIEKGNIHHSLDKSHAFENTSITLALHQSSDTHKNVKI